MKLKIKNGCIDCPFLYSFDMSSGHGCRAEEFHSGIEKTIHRDAKTYLLVTPEWCPLEKEPIIITKNN